MTKNFQIKYPDNIIYKYISPNFNKRPASKNIDTLVIHYTGMNSAQEALNNLCNDDDPKVSSHYIIFENGSIYSLVPEEKRAWHAGVSAWGNSQDVNDTSIGIEIVNKGHLVTPLEPFTKEQMDSVIKLSKAIIEKYSIKAYNVVGHSDIAPSRKKDPGELFDWELLSKNGIGLWFDGDLKSDDNNIVATQHNESHYILKIQEKLYNYGYNIKKDGLISKDMSMVINAFKRHFLQKKILNNQDDSDWDSESEAIINNLLLKKQKI